MRLLRIVHLHMGGFSSCIWQKRMQQCGPGVSDLEIEKVHATDRNNFVHRALNYIELLGGFANCFGGNLVDDDERVCCFAEQMCRSKKMKGTKFDERGVRMGEGSSTYIVVLPQTIRDPILGTNQYWC